MAAASGTAGEPTVSVTVSELRERILGGARDKFVTATKVAVSCNSIHNEVFDLMGCEQCKDGIVNCLIHGLKELLAMFYMDNVDERVKLEDIFNASSTREALPVKVSVNLRKVEDFKAVTYGQTDAKLELVCTVIPSDGKYIMYHVYAKRQIGDDDEPVDVAAIYELSKG